MNKKTLLIFFSRVIIYWSNRRDLNPQQPDWKSGTLANWATVAYYGGPGWSRTSVLGFSVRRANRVRHRPIYTGYHGRPRRVDLLGFHIIYKSFGPTMTGVEPDTSGNRTRTTLGTTVALYLFCYDYWVIILYLLTKSLWLSQAYLCTNRLYKFSTVIVILCEESDTLTSFRRYLTSGWGWEVWTPISGVKVHCTDQLYEPPIWYSVLGSNQ